MKKIFLYPILFVWFVSLACTSSLYEKPMPTATFKPPMPTMIFKPLVVGTPTLSMQDFSATMVSNEQNNALTKQANEISVEMKRLEIERAGIKATADANNIKATSEAGAITAEAYNRMMTANAIDAINTQAAGTHAAATAVAGISTAVYAPTAAMWTAEAVAREMRIQEAEVQNVELARDRQQSKNMLDAFLPWTLVLVAMFVLGRGLFEYLKNRIFTRDDHGRMPAIMRQLPNGAVTLTRLELMTSPHTVIMPDGTIYEPRTEDAKEQSDVTRRAQIVDAIASLPIPYARNAQTMMRSEFGNTGRSSVQIVSEAKALSPVLEEAEAALVQE